MEPDEPPGPLGLAIVALIAALLWGLLAPSLGAGRDDPKSTAPAAATSVLAVEPSGQRRGP